MTAQMSHAEAKSALMNCATRIRESARHTVCSPGPCRCPKCDADYWADRLFELASRSAPGQANAFDMMELAARRAGIWEIKPVERSYGLTTTPDGREIWE